MCEKHLLILTFTIEWCHCENGLCDLDLLFEGQKFKFCISLKLLELAQKCVGGICR